MVKKNPTCSPAFESCHHQEVDKSIINALWIWGGAAEQEDFVQPSVLAPKQYSERDPIMEYSSTFDRALFAERDARYSEAIQLFRTCLAEGEHDGGEVLFHCGWCTEQGSGNTRDALRYYEMASEEARVPECKLNSFFRSGWLLMHQKEYAQAATAFRRGIDFAELARHKSETYNQSAFWYAVCLESQGWYIDAIKWYRLVRTLSPQLDPESRFRELVCLNHVGSYPEAFSLCQSFDAPPPGGFPAERYSELRASIAREAELLQRCLACQSSFVMTPGHHGTR